MIKCKISNTLTSNHSNISGTGCGADFYEKQVSFHVKKKFKRDVKRSSVYPEGTGLPVLGSHGRLRHVAGHLGLGGGEAALGEGEEGETG